MKPTLLATLLLLGLVTTAQKITENTVVKDSAGTVYPAAIWRALLMKGDYVLKAENRSDPATAYYLGALKPQ